MPEFDITAETTDREIVAHVRSIGLKSLSAARECAKLQKQRNECIKAREMARAEAWARQQGEALQAAAGTRDHDRAGKAADPRDARPDHEMIGRASIFRDHNCYRCKDGERPCVKGNPRNCDSLHARND